MRALIGGLGIAGGVSIVMLSWAVPVSATVLTVSAIGLALASVAL